MEKKLIDELNKLPISEWAKIWCEFNTFKFPESLKHLKPDWWDLEAQRQFEYLWPIMELIRRTIGEKTCNREWNRERMTDEEHEIFWRNKHKINF